MNTIRITTAQALVRFLQMQYLEADGVRTPFVEGVMTVFGHGNVLGLGLALEEGRGRLRVHQGRNEQGMAHVAMGFAKQHARRKIYACTSSVGPGAANMVTAAATATANRIPVLFLPGDTYACRQPDPVLQQVEQPHDFSLTTNDAFRSVSKYWDRVHRPEQLMTAMISAMRVLTDPAETGAVTVALPQDVQGEAWDFPEVFFRERVWRLERTAPTPAMMEDALQQILAARKPLIIAGGGVRYSGAADALEKLSTALDIPFAETQAGKGAVPATHPLNLGGIGTTGNLAANLAAHEADLIIGVGTRYTDFTTSSKWLFQNPGVRFLNINVARMDSIKLDGTAVTADARTALEMLLERLQGTAWRHGWENRPAAFRAQWQTERSRLFGTDAAAGDFSPEVAGHLDHVLSEFADVTGSRLTQTRVLGLLNAYLPENAVVVGASGSLPGDLQRVWDTPQADGYHMEYGYSCMGYEVNAALGVKLAAPDREVYAMVGDGSYMMLHSELATSVQERRKINVLLFDNMAFGCINNLQMGNGMGSFGTEFRFREEASDTLTGPLVPVDFAMSAAAYGCKTYSVRNEAELLAALEDSRKQTVSTLLDIKVLPKTMTHDYASWWRTGNSEVAAKEAVTRAAEANRAQRSKARPY